MAIFRKAIYKYITDLTICLTYTYVDDNKLWKNVCIPTCEYPLRTSSRRPGPPTPCFAHPTSVILYLYNTVECSDTRNNWSYYEWVQSLFWNSSWAVLFYCLSKFYKFRQIKLMKTRFISRTLKIELDYAACMYYT